MTPELIAMIGGGLSGFVMKLIGTQMENQARQFEIMLGKQKASDASADAAAKRHSGVLVRRFLVASTVFAIVIAPFVFAWTDVGVTIGRETKGFLGLFKGIKWDTVQGFVILPEIRQTSLAMISFYWCSSQIK